VNIDVFVLGGIAVLNLVTVFMTYLVKKDVVRTWAEMSELKVQTNHKMDQLIEAKAGEAFGKGVAQERADTEAKTEAKTERTLK